MTKLKLLGAAAIIVLVATVVRTVVIVRAQGTSPQTITVTITPNSNPSGPPSVNPDSVDLYKNQNQQVEWTCSTGCDFTVSFPKSHGKPFNDSSFNKAHPKSGVPTGPPGTYPYTVKVGQGSTDPQIIVH